MTVSSNLMECWTYHKPNFLVKLRMKFEVNEVLAGFNGTMMAYRQRVVGLAPSLGQEPGTQQMKAFIQRLGWNLGQSSLSST
jgi:hypothetical protein